MSSNLSYWLTHSWLSSAIFAKTKIYECSWYDLEAVDLCSLQQSIFQIHNSSETNGKQRIRIGGDNKRKRRLVSRHVFEKVLMFVSSKWEKKLDLQKGKETNKCYEIWKFFSSFTPLKSNNPKIYQSKFKIRRKKTCQKRYGKWDRITHTQSHTIAERENNSEYG